MNHEWPEKYGKIKKCMAGSNGAPPKMVDHNTVATLINYVNEFYNTTDERRRMELKTILDGVQKGPNSWRIATELIDPNYPYVVQFFGATILHDALHREFRSIAESPETTDYMKMYLIQKLTVGVKSFKQTLLNKLFATTAVYMLHCMPDIWGEPLEDLAQIWSDQPELLLRVFTEVAVEFTRLTWELQIRGVLKSELLKMTPKIVKIVKDVLTDSETSPSLRNAALECVEMWLRLPGSNLEDFAPIFEVVFSNILNDCDALARILTNIKLNEGLPKNPQLFLSIADFLRTHVCSFLAQEMQNRVLSERNEDLKEETEDLCTLINAMSEFVKNGVHKLVIMAAKAAVTGEDMTTYNILIDLCTFFKYVATFPPYYSIGEYFSDLTEGFWSELMEDLVVEGVTPEINEQKKAIRSIIQQFFLEILSSAVQKVAYLPNMEKVASLQAIEYFREYRLNRPDVSLNAYKIAPKETITYLSNALVETLSQKNLYLSEGVLYYIKQASDYMDEKDLPILLPVLVHCHEARLWMSENQDPNYVDSNIRAFIRFGKMLMDTCRCLSHLVLTSDNVAQILPKVMEMCLVYLSVQRVDEECLRTVEIYIKEKESYNTGVADSIISSCYNYFTDESKSHDLRLTAMRCVGYGLSQKERTFVLDSLDKILTPRLATLSKLITEEAVGLEDRRKGIAFELGVIKELCSTLHRKYTTDAQQDALAAAQGTDPVFMVVEHCIPLFTELISKPYLEQEDDKLVEELCEILGSALIALQSIMEPFMGFYLNFTNRIVGNHGGPACKLLKNIFSVFHDSPTIRPRLFNLMANWFQEEYFRLTHLVNDKPPFATKSHEFIEFAGNITRKHLPIKMSTSSPEMADLQRFLQASAMIATMYFDHSDDNITIREAFKMLGHLLKNSIKNDTQLVRAFLGEVGERLITSTFNSVFKEYASQTLVPISEVLYYAMQAYPAESRALIRQLPDGNHEMVAQLFNARDFRNFKMVLSKICQYATKIIGSV